MTFILIISILVLAAVAFATAQLMSKSSGESRDRILPPPASGGLFDKPSSEDASLVEEKRDPSNERKILIERAMSGDASALSDAHGVGDSSLYSEVLDALVEYAANRQEDFRALVTKISKSDELRANVKLAERVIEVWKDAPGRRETIEMLHVAALSDDAVTYLKATEMALEYWQSGQISSLTKDEICDLLESQYWVLAPEARRTGKGFALKERLAGIRRKLATARPAS